MCPSAPSTGKAELGLSGDCQLFPLALHSSARVPAYQLPEEKSSQTSGFGRGMEKVNWWVAALRFLVLSWSGDLDFFLLGTGWAATLSLLVVYRAGVANQASTEPGNRDREAWAGI